MSNFIGEMRLLPFRPDELPDTWYFMDGTSYPTDSPQGWALGLLSPNFKKDWGISVSGNNINLPNWFDTDGRGFFPRAVDGESRTPGNVQEDAIRNIEGRIDGNHSAESKNAVAASGAVYLHSAGIRRGVEAVIDNNGVLWSFDASRVVPTAEENRPQNIGMTPAIFLGVSKIVPEVE